MYSSLMKLPLLMQQTICREIKEFYKFILLNTPNISYIIAKQKVKILAMYDNPQITKAPGGSQKLGIKEFSKLSM